MSAVPSPPPDDVLILGSGIGGSVLATCLAAKGLRVRVLDATTHPRFAIGEATTPDSSFRLKLLAQRYGVPEIGQLGTFDQVRDNIGPSAGIKRAFSFLYHREGHATVPTESHQYPTFAPPFGPDCHLYRQDVDAWMLTVAMRYGVQVQQRTRANAIRFDDEGVEVDTQHGETLRARFLVDACGHRSPLAKQLGLHPEVCPAKTNSRAIFTHMVGVKPYDGAGASLQDHGLPYPTSETTLHHVFPGGWMWVIPFNNHPDATNPLCSVGLMLDCERYPATGLEAEEEFRSFIARFPSIEPQFREAKAFQPWVSTGRVQYRTTQMVGDRWALTAHAAGFVDPLFSSGLALNFAVTDQLAARLIDACAQDRFTRKHFLPIEESFYRNYDLFDRVVANSYRSWDDWSLWDAWYRVWVIGLLIGTGVNANIYMKHLGGDDAWLKEAIVPPATGLLGSEVPLCRKFLDGAFEAFEDLQLDPDSSQQIADKIRLMVGQSSCSPDYWKWDDTTHRATPVFTVPGMIRMYLWFHWNAPPELSRAMFDWSLGPLLPFMLKRYLTQRKAGKRKAQRFLRDSLLASDDER